MNEFWRIEGPRTFAALGAGWLFGFLAGNAWAGVALAALVLLWLHLRSAMTLLQWLRDPKRVELPDGIGVWEQLNNTSLDKHRRYRKRKKRLASMLQEFRASTAALPDAAVVLNADGAIAWFNHAAVALLGLKTQRDIGQRISNLLRHPDFTRYFNSEHEQGGGVEMPSPRSAATTLWIRVIPYGRQQRLLIARDISAFKQLEKTRRDFVANASHELRTPLTVVRGYLDMMVEDSQDEGPLARWQAPLTEMRRQSTRMQQIIVDLLKLANLESGGVQAKQEQVDVPALIRGCIEEAEVLSDNQHSIQAEVDEDLLLLGRQSEIHSVVTNLLGNAVRYTPAQGKVDLRWRLDGRDAILEVSDTGIGIAARDIPRLTERFYRADVARSRASGGTGLGLAIVKHALERHDASLTIDSRPGTGSTFRCRFPAVRVHWRQDTRRLAG